MFGIYGLEYQKWRVAGFPSSVSLLVDGSQCPVGPDGRLRVILSLRCGIKPVPNIYGVEYQHLGCQVAPPFLFLRSMGCFVPLVACLCFWAGCFVLLPSSWFLGSLFFPILS